MADSTPSTSIVADQPDSAGCECIAKSSNPDGVLAKGNTKIGTTLEISRQTGKVYERVALETSVIQKKRGARPMRLFPNYCPFCGTRYPTADDSAIGADQ